MARGIISTILGGVAGGLEGLGVQQQRRREEERERDRDEREAAQRAFLNQFNLAQAGFEPGTPMRADVAGQAAESLRQTPVGRALDQAPLFAAPAEPGQQRALRDSAANVFGEPDFSDAQRGRFVPDVQDERYYQLTTPEGQTFSRMTDAELRRMAVAERDEGRDYEAKLLRDEREFELEKMRMQRQNNIDLEGIRRRDAVDLIMLNRQFARDDARDPELRRLRAEEMLMQMITRGGEFSADPAYIGQVADAVGRIAGVHGADLLGFVLNDSDDTGAGAGSVPTRIAPGLMRIQEEEAQEAFRQERIAELQDYLRQYQEALRSRPLDRRLREDIARTQADLERLTGNRALFGGASLPRLGGL